MQHCLHKIYSMPNDPKEQDKAKNNEEVDHNNMPKSRDQQQKSDPQMTELAGFTDSDEDLEPKGTDSPVSKD